MATVRYRGFYVEDTDIPRIKSLLRDYTKAGLATLVVDDDKRRDDFAKRLGVYHDRLGNLDDAFFEFVEYVLPGKYKNTAQVIADLAAIKAEKSAKKARKRLKQKKCKDA